MTGIHLYLAYPRYMIMGISVYRLEYAVHTAEYEYRIAQDKAHHAHYQAGGHHIFLLDEAGGISKCIRRCGDGEYHCER